MATVETVGALPDIASADARIASDFRPTDAPSTRAEVMLQHPAWAVARVGAGRLRSVNPAWRRLFRMPAGAVSDLPLKALFADAHDVERFEREAAARMVADLANGPSATVRHALTRHDGTTFSAEVVVWLLDGTVVDEALASDAVWHVRDLTAERAPARELHEFGDDYRELSLHQWDMTLVVDRKGRLSYVSPSLASTLGYDVAALLGEPFRVLLDARHAQAAGQWLRAASPRPGKDRMVSEADAYRLHVMDWEGMPHVFACRPRNCFDVPSIMGMVVHARDVTATIAEEEALRATRRRADSMRDDLVALASATSSDPEARIVALLDRARERLATRIVVYRPSHAAEPVVCAGTSDGLPPPMADASGVAWRAIADLAVDATIGDDERGAYAAAGIVAVVDAPVVVDGTLRGWVSACADDERRWSDVEVDFLIGIAQLVAQAFATPSSSPSTALFGTPTLDGLTGLPDRASARRWLEERVAELQPDASLTLISLDLDRLQDINQRHGHDVGDSVITQTAGLLVELIGEGGYVARIDGDAFGIVLTNSAPKAVEETVALLRDRIERMADGDGGLPHVEASIGTARMPNDAVDAATLWLHAELAMREAKSRGRGQSVFFTQRLASETRVRRDLDVEISEALARNEFVLFYQPQIALATGRIIGLEALLRWQHPTRGLVLPSIFMDAAVERGLTDAMTKAVLGMVCEQIAAWRRAGDFPEIPVAVNVVGTQFHDRRLPAQVAASLLRSGLPARLLVLELTEQTLIDDDSETQRVVKELDRLGVRTSVGGFALGHGALKQLRQLHVGQIKLDRGFVQDLTVDEASGAVVSTMIDVARRLKCQVVAEGVETREQFEQLRALGCEAGQGFFFGAPLSAQEIRAFVDNNRQNPIC